jgi:hypothetical protein
MSLAGLPRTVPVPEPRPSWQRLMIAVVAGIAVTFLIVIITTFAAVMLVLQGADPAAIAEGRVLPPRYLYLGLAFSAIAALLGGYTSGRIARPESPRASTRASLLLAAVLIVLCLLELLDDGAKPGQPAWYPWALLAIGPLAAVLGGRLARGRGSLEAGGAELAPRA